MTAAVIDRRGHRPHGPRALGAVALLLSLPGLWLVPKVFFAGWLSAWWWCLGLVLGAAVNGWIHRLTGGRWGHALRPALQALLGCMPLLLVLGLPLALGAGRLYPWADPHAPWAHDLSQPRFLQAWLSPLFFGARVLAYAAVWWWLSRPSAFGTKGRAVRSLMAQLLVGSLAAVDLLASLLPGWHSSGFGLRALAGQWLAGSALATALVCRLRPPPPAAEPPVTRDLGNLLLMNLLLWAYLAYMEFLVIWAEDLPHEVIWFVPRLQSGWRWVGVALVAGQLLLPLLALLFRRLKDSPRHLAAVAAALVATSALDAAWLVLPSVDARSAQVLWLLPLQFGGMALLVFGGVPAAMRAGGADERA